MRIFKNDTNSYSIKKVYWLCEKNKLQKSYRNICFMSLVLISTVLYIPYLYCAFSDIINNNLSPYLLCLLSTSFIYLTYLVESSSYSNLNPSIIEWVKYLLKSINFKDFKYIFKRCIIEVVGFILILNTFWYIIHILDINYIFGLDVHIYYVRLFINYFLVIPVYLILKNGFDIYNYIFIKKNLLTIKTLILIIAYIQSRLFFLIIIMLGLYLFERQVMEITSGLIFLLADIFYINMFIVGNKLLCNDPYWFLEKGKKMQYYECLETIGKDGDTVDYNYSEKGFREYNNYDLMRYVVLHGGWPIMGWLEDPEFINIKDYHKGSKGYQFLYLIRKYPTEVVVHEPKSLNVFIESLKRNPLKPGLGRVEVSDSELRSYLSFSIDNIKKAKFFIFSLDEARLHESHMDRGDRDFMSEIGKKHCFKSQHKIKQYLYKMGLNTSDLTNKPVLKEIYSKYYNYNKNLLHRTETLKLEIENIQTKNNLEKYNKVVAELKNIEIKNILKKTVIKE